MKLQAPLMLVLLSMTGCAIANETYMPDGRKGYSISCDGAAVGIDKCFEKAGDLCAARGYDMINREGQVVPQATATAGFVQMGSFNTKSILIACK
jgi:hypothetical protein